MDSRRAGVQNAVGTSFEIPDRDRDRGRMEVLESIGAPIRRHNPATKERLDRREVFRREGMAKLARSLRLGNDVERGVARLERRGQELTREELEMVDNRESLCLVMEMFH